MAADTMTAALEVAVVAIAVAAMLDVPRLVGATTATASIGDRMADELAAASQTNKRHPDGNDKPSATTRPIGTGARSQRASGDSDDAMKSPDNHPAQPPPADNAVPRY
ncbi:hypothetical protein [Mycobacterium sp. M26]|uniref:hypothetical protein n=1 Tax=Mycobacterium sp. M26 TaxID=1762962 RepID=UPI0012E32F93|nr:hypothetical protein [Mycobacterium sp. M26]